MYIAHRKIREDDRFDEQTLLSHLTGTADRARAHAGVWGGNFAYLCAMAHDAGKYSGQFQQRIRGKNIRVDHATAGGQLLYETLRRSKLGMLAAYCVMGHHGGLPNGGSPHQDTQGDTTLHGRLKRHVEDYSAFHNEVTLDPIASFNPPWKDGFDAAFFTRMAFSALVDADWLDTGAFHDGREAPRGGFDTISGLYKKMRGITEKYLSPGKALSDLFVRRNGLLRDCLAAAELPGGLFSLTAPTGSGKTVASLAFALRHAALLGKRRVIYVIPYNTIIEQNAKVFEDILGPENVLRHTGDVAFDGDDEASVNKRNSVENWDYPLIVTSSVRFFESLFANRPSHCRKLHNISDSVLIFDEAQMIPLPYLVPCVRAMKTLVSQYGCSAVLATATQSSLEDFFHPLPMREITQNPRELYTALRRATIRVIDERLSDEALAGRLAGHERVLCVVGTRRAAQELYTLCKRREPEGTYHLSTTMYPAHRARVLDAVRARLIAGEVCRVISTSLVEAGVDLDFDTVYRERAGLDSIVQAAGRCNREGKRDSGASIVYVYTARDHAPPATIRPNIDAAADIMRRCEDIASPEAIEAYFRQLHYALGEERLDSKKIVAMFNEGARSMCFPFADVAAAFRLIDDQAQRTVYIPHEAPELEARLRGGERSRALFRALGPYGVSLYDRDVIRLSAIGELELLRDENPRNETLLLLNRQYYSDEMGVKLSPEGGQGYYA